MQQAPCKDCPDRHRNCWAECEKFLAFKESRKDLAEKKWEYRQRENDFFGATRKRRR